MCAVSQWEFSRKSERQQNTDALKIDLWTYVFDRGAQEQNWIMTQSRHVLGIGIGSYCVVGSLCTHVSFLE